MRISSRPSRSTNQAGFFTVAVRVSFDTGRSSAEKRSIEQAMGVRAVGRH